MTKREGAVTMKGNPLTLAGNEINVGDKAPDFKLVANDMSEKTLADFAGKTIIISSVPSLDTPICDLQTKRFNSEAQKMNDDAVILTISMDLPFAQARWCGASGADKVITLSDHKYASFGQNYGLIVDELRLDARAVLIIDGKGIIRYIQLVKEIATEPDYDAVLEAIKNL